VPRPEGGFSDIDNTSFKKECCVTGQFDLYGVFLPWFSALSLCAYGLLRVLTSLLDRLGLYQAVWHRSLFNLALYITVLGGLSALFNWLQT
jgi:hypothetical protein